MRQLTDFQQRAASAALDKLLTGDYFDITGLRKVAQLTGAEMRGPDLEALEALHCVHYSKMDRVLAIQVREKCLELLGLPPQVLEAEVPREEPKPPEPTKRPRLAFWKTA